VASCMHPGRNLPHHTMEPSASEAMLALIAFCFLLPDTNALRLGRCATAGGPAPRWRLGAGLLTFKAWCREG
jgi:hypothetical protein